MLEVSVCDSTVCVCVTALCVLAEERTKANMRTLSHGHALIVTLSRSEVLSSKIRSKAGSVTKVPERVKH